MATRRHKDKGEETSENKCMKMSEDSVKEKKLSENNNKTNNTIDQDYIKDEYRDATEKFLKNENLKFLTYAISICETFLNPGNQDIHMNKKLLKPKLIKNLQKLENKEKFLCSEAEDEFSSTDADNSKLGKGTNNDKGTNTDGKNADKGEGINTNRNGKGANTDSKDGEETSIKNNKGEGIYDSDRSYNTEEEDQYLSSLFDIYELPEHGDKIVYNDNKVKPFIGYIEVETAVKLGDKRLASVLWLVVQPEKEIAHSPEAETTVTQEINANIHKTGVIIDQEGKTPGMRVPQAMDDIQSIPSAEEAPTATVVNDLIVLNECHSLDLPSSIGNRI
ncbi:hypothetical protein GLOIN_2v1877636 [Rhizophagus clarus]|uniref:Uncharacterized protein n=1 Tax=Rhizophagus clarus TaxID=94130 RepID=A0A8H3QB18_9GLOM|nr:hypothetical protein GLOIN_2v1877636 [Rhizophagus clarus]